MHELINKECLVVATSHYSELKIHAYQSKNIVNASVEFDIKTLKPTYRLLMGVPGMSNALDIAAILGLPNHIIEKAKNYVHQQDDSISNVLDKLVKQSTVLDEKIRIVEEERKQIIKKQNELDKSIEDSYDKRNKIIEEANIEKEKLINQSKEEIENILYDLENLKKKDVKMHEIANIKHRISSLDTLSLEKEYVLEKENLEIGDNVFVKSHQMYGNVIKKIKDDVYEVQMGFNH